MLTYEDPTRGEGGDTTPDTPSYIHTTTTTKVALPNTSNGVVIVADTVDSTNNTITYDAGSYYLSVLGEYVASVSLNTDVSGAGSTLEFWAEMSADGVAWVASPTSGEFKEVSNRGEGAVKISTTLTLTAPVYYRLKLRRTKSAALELSSYTLTNGVISPAAVVAVARVSGS